MAVIQEAMSQEDFDKWDKGLPLKKKEIPDIPEPTPIEPDIGYYKDLRNKIATIEGRRETKIAIEGHRIIGFHVTIGLKEGKNLDGWMVAPAFYKLRKELVADGKIDTSLIIDLQISFCPGSPKGSG